MGLPPAVPPLVAPVPPEPAGRPLEGLEDFLEMLAQAEAGLAEGRGAVDTRVERLEALADDATERTTDAASALDAVEASLDAARSALVEELGDWQQALARDEADLAAAGAAVAAEAERLASRLEESRSTLEAAADEVAPAFDAWDQGVAALDGSVEEWEERLVATLDGAAHALEDLHARTGDAAEEVQRHTLDLADETATDLASRAASTLDEGRSVLDVALPAVHQTLDGARQAASDTFVALATGGLEAQDEMLVAVADTSASVQDFVAGGALDLVATATDAAVREALDRVAQELAELTATLVAGQGVTAAAAPLFPELAVAKKIVEVINDLLEALPGF